jgi:D-lactate dehydrogenase
MPALLPPPYDQLLNALEAFIPAPRLISDPLRTMAYGTDASFYRLNPKLVIDVVDEREVQACLNLAHQYATPVTFRAAGTSLSGQAITDSVLIRLAWGWRDYCISEDARQIRLQPGVIGGDANRYLAKHQRKIGPDPASINTAKIGGIAANNASGMCCGTAQNSYQTVRSMRVILANGSLLDTGDSASREAFKKSEPELLERLDKLAVSARDNTALAERIRHKFKIKNTTGYSLNALIDFKDPIDILQHLMIGSEGTLGFIAEVTYNTVENHLHKASALVYFADIKSACDAVGLLKPEPVAAVELMDRAAMRSVENQTGVPAELKQLPETAAALLIETRANDAQLLAEQMSHIEKALSTINTLFPICFTDVEKEYSQLWNIRKGLFPSVGAMRETGTTVIIEDVSFPVEKLAAATLDLQQLFAKYAYHQAIIFGHALEGNLHFVFTQDFGSDKEIERYREFMDDVCHMVVDKYDGSLKGEHSTGRNMAPYVELEWGAEAYALMRQIKALFDPENLLNPGVIFNDDKQVHVKNLKPLFPVDSLIDKCIECGFCEPACPSRALSLTPRQRIVGLREMARLEANGDQQSADALRDIYQYQGIDTCAGDSLCSLSCPVNIDTGRMMKQLRGQQLGDTANKIGGWLANNYDMACTTTRVSLGAADFNHKLLGSKLMGGLTAGMRKLSGNQIPLWNASMPSVARMPKQVTKSQKDKPRVVYFPSCASRTMGPAKGDPESATLTQVTESLLRKAGFEVVYPKDCDSLCCGMPFESKGLAQQAEQKADQLANYLREISRDGRDAIVFDTSPCAYRTRTNTDLPLYDIAEFVHDVLLDKLQISKLNETVALHTTCSSRKMYLQDKLQHILELCVDEVIVPDGVSCCGWAGDKGFTQPELNASALQNLKPELNEDCVAGYSTSRTCEIGLSLHSGLYYRSIVYLVDKCSEAKDCGE